MKKMVKMVEDAKIDRKKLVSMLLEFIENILCEHEKPQSPTEFGFIQ